MVFGMSIANRQLPPPVEPEVPEGFVERRPASSRYEQAGIERRQFPNAGIEISTEGYELARAIDLYKFENKQQRVNVEELLAILRSLGYVQMKRFNE
jgi:hypothetical protein